MHFVAKALPIKSVENREACPISSGTSSMSHSTFSKFQWLATESALINPAFVRTAKGTTYECSGISLFNIKNTILDYYIALSLFSINTLILYFNLSIFWDS